MFCGLFNGIMLDFRVLAVCIDVVQNVCLLNMGTADLYGSAGTKLLQGVKMQAWVNVKDRLLQFQAGITKLCLCYLFL